MVRAARVTPVGPPRGAQRALRASTRGVQPAAGPAHPAGQKNWTLSQRIRTFAEIPIEAAILDTDAPPIYQQIAFKAFQLQQLGLSNSAIVRRLGVTDKTVNKAIIIWYGRMHHCPDGQGCRTAGDPKVPAGTHMPEIASS